MRKRGSESSRHLSTPTELDSDGLSSEMRQLNCDTTRKERKFNRRKLGVVHKSEEEHNNASQRRKEDRKLNQELSFTKIFLYPLLLHTSNDHVSGRAGSQFPTFTTRVEKTQAHHDQYPTLEHSRAELYEYLPLAMTLCW